MPTKKKTKTTTSVTDYKAKFARLKNPFSGKHLDWRVQSCGKTAKGKVWAKVIPYLQARAVQDRLDRVFGPECWKTEFKTIQVGNEMGVECTLYIKVGEEWVGKSDIGVFSNVEMLKGAYSDALKRAAVHWGIGRFLYATGEHFAKMVDKPGYNDVNQAFTHRGKTKDGTEFYWQEPILSKEVDDEDEEWDYTNPDATSILDDLPPQSKNGTGTHKDKTETVYIESAKSVTKNPPDARPGAVLAVPKTEAKKEIPNWAPMSKADAEREFSNIKKVLSDANWTTKDFNDLMSTMFKKQRVSQLSKAEVDILKTRILNGAPPNAAPKENTINPSVDHGPSPA